MADSKDMKFDTRIMLRNLQAGDITKEEVDKHLASLPDVEANAETISFDTQGQEGAAEAATGSSAPAPASEGNEGHAP